MLAHFSVKRTEPKGAFEHRAIKELIIKTIFTASKGMDCLADAFEDGETHLFNPVPLETIALAATAVLSDIMVRYSFRILTLHQEKNLLTRATRADYIAYVAYLVL